MEKVEVQQLIDSNSDRLSYDTNKGKSAVWEYFKIFKVDTLFHLSLNAIGAIRYLNGNPEMVQVD